jgi:hypothetical protein
MTASSPAEVSITGDTDDLNQRLAIMQLHTLERLIDHMPVLVERLLDLSQSADTDRTRLNATKLALRLAGVDAPSRRGDR